MRGSTSSQQKDKAGIYTLAREGVYSQAKGTNYLYTSPSKEWVGWLVGPHPGELRAGLMCPTPTSSPCPDTAGDWRFYSRSGLRLWK